MEMTKKDLALAAICTVVILAATAGIGFIMRIALGF